MKRFFTFLLSLFALTPTFSQSFEILDSNGVSILNDTIFVDDIIDASDVDQKISRFNLVTVKNNGSETLNLKLTRYEETIVPGTGDALCWGGTCYGKQTGLAVWPVDDIAVIASGADDTGFETYHFPQLLDGQSTYRYHLFDANNAFNSGDFYIQYRMDYTTSIDEEAPDPSSVFVYPNPANDYIKFDFDRNSNVIERFEVKNLLGKTVIDQSFINQNQLDVSSLSSGVYFINFISEDQTLVTKKFIKK